VFSQSAAQLFVPDRSDAEAALRRTTHLGVGAHPDDLELMTWHGIAACYGSRERWFSGVIVTDGASSPRAGRYAAHSDEQMRIERWSEQKQAARLGEYSAVAALGFQSSQINAGPNRELVDDLVAVLQATTPEVVYAHNLFDAHDTHLAVALHLIAALRTLSESERPKAVYGCEVWRSLDWLPDSDRCLLDVSSSEPLGTTLASVYESQIAGGKRYDLASVGRRRANATYADPHGVDRMSAVEYAMDMTPLMDPSVDIQQHLVGILRKLSDGIAARLLRFSW